MIRLLAARITGRKDSCIAVHKVINYNSAVNKGRQPNTYVFGIEFGGQNDKKDGQMPIFFLLNSLRCCIQFRLLV